MTFLKFREGRVGVWIEGEDSPQGEIVTKITLFWEKNKKRKRFNFQEFKKERRFKFSLIFKLGEEISQYLRRERKTFSPFPLKIVTYSPFYRKVWKEIKKIPYGDTSTYGEVAQKIGIGSPRQVGRALKNNPFPLLIPCHRVIKKDGSWGGYRGGEELKKFLLKLEKENVRKKKSLP